MVTGCYKYGDLVMTPVELAAKQELIDKIVSSMVEPNVKLVNQSEEDYAKFVSFMKSLKTNKNVTAKLPIEFALRSEIFNKIKLGEIFIDSSSKFTGVFTTERSDSKELNSFDARYVGNEFSYSFLDNHPGIINVDSIKDIPIDYEGLMAVPVTVLVAKNIFRFNIHRVIYTPKFRGKYIYPRVVVSNKYSIT
jgi:hypothetical protein